MLAGGEVTFETDSFSIYQLAAGETQPAEDAGGACANECSPDVHGLSCVGCSGSCMGAGSTGTDVSGGGEFSCQCVDDVWDCESGGELDAGTEDTESTCANECRPESDGLSCAGCGGEAGCARQTQSGGYTCDCVDDTWECVTD